MKIRTTYVSNSSSSSYIITCTDISKLEYIKEALNFIIEGFKRLNPNIDVEYTVEGDHLECYTYDGEYLNQSMLDALHDYLEYGTMLDEQGNALDISVSKVYNG